MELRVLRYFVEVAREGSFTHAAQRLHVSQPTLSRQTKDLEIELGKPLFIRSNYTVHLTDEGLLLKQRAEDMLAIADKTIEDFHTLDTINGGVISIGAAESNGIAPIIEVMQHVMDRYPATRFDCYTSGADTINERLDKGLLDFAIIVQEVDASRYPFIKLPTVDRWGLIMRKDNPLANHSSIHIHDLEQIPLILSRQTMGNEMPKWFGEHHDHLHVIATYDLLFNAALMVKQGFGSVLGFEGLVDTGETSELCFRPLVPELVSPMYIIWSKYPQFTPIAKVFLDALKQRFRQSEDVTSQ